MKILFLCASQRPGHCGVGDYTRRLAENVQAKGWTCAIVALNEKGNPDTWPVEPSVRTLHLSAARPWEERIAEARTFARDFGPDWVSLQFVPYSFHPKGLCWSLGPWVDSIAGTAKRHIFFHELSVGLHREDSRKNQLIGIGQRVCLRRAMKYWQPKVIHTHAPVYQSYLQEWGLAAQLLPLFSNIPISAPGPVHSEFDAWVEKKKENPEAILLGGYFGAFYPGAAHAEFIRNLIEFSHRTKRELVCFLVGHQSADAIDRWKTLAADQAEPASWINLGALPEEKVSRYLQQLDFGIGATPFALAGKSAAIAAMIDHGLPVLLPRHDWTSRLDTSNNVSSPGLFPAHDGRFAQDDAWLKSKSVPDDSTARQTEKFIASLSEV